MVTAAWIWLYIGAGLMLAELLAPGFVIFFFGLAAVTVSALRAIFGESFGLTGQLAAFSILTVVYLVFLRRYVSGWFGGDESKSSVDLSGGQTGRIGRVTEAIEPPQTGRVTVGDAAWTAASAKPLAVGTAVRVISQDNLTLQVEELS